MRAKRHTIRQPKAMSPMGLARASRLGLDALAAFGAAALAGVMRAPAHLSESGSPGCPSCDSSQTR